MSIDLSNISKQYDKQHALKNVSFTIKKGEVVGLLGPNGAGKSTLMKILTTYLSPSQGDAKVNGFDIHTEKIAVKKSIGYLSEHNPLPSDMYVKEYLHYTAEIFKVSKKDIDPIIVECGLATQTHKRINTLSKGYRQRVGLAAALIGNPEVLILDEPTTGLDPNQLLEIRTLIKNLGKEKTILLSTHIMQEVEVMCNRVIIIHEGCLVADKKLAALHTNEGQCIEVAFDYRVEEKILLEQLSHIESVENISGFLYELTFSTSKDMRAMVFDFANDNGLRIVQLNLKNENLEQLFLSLTSPS